MMAPYMTIAIQHSIIKKSQTQNMNILEKIINHKQKEVTERKSLYPVPLLEKSIYFKTPVVSLKKYLKREDKLGVIAEFKRRSPSKGDINLYAKVEQVSIGYMQAGASALSVLTDKEFFGGQLSDLTEARTFNFCPILRKDFIIDDYQLIEAKSAGADVVLLIAACLTAEKLHTLAATAKNLGLEVLMEIHDEAELEKLNSNIDVLGVNNRDLTVFKTDLQQSVRLAGLIPEGQVKISESGIKTPEDILTLIDAGYDGFLIGEQFMKHADPARACTELIRKTEHLQKSKLWKSKYAD